MRALVLGRDAEGVKRMRVQVRNAPAHSLYWCIGETPFNTELQRAVADRTDVAFRQVPIDPKDPSAMDQLKTWTDRILREHQLDVVEVYRTPKPPKGWTWILNQAHRRGVLIRDV